MGDKIVAAAPGFEVLQMTYDNSADRSRCSIRRYPIVGWRVSGQGVVDLIAIGFKTNIAQPFVIKSPTGEIHCAGDRHSAWPGDMAPCWESESAWVQAVKERADGREDVA
jgi:hypothetical protein